jgi:hypothetical protein
MECELSLMYCNCPVDGRSLVSTSPVKGCLHDSPGKKTSDAGEMAEAILVHVELRRERYSKAWDKVAAARRAATEELKKRNIAAHELGRALDDVDRQKCLFICGFVWHRGSW